MGGNHREHDRALASTLEMVERILDEMGVADLPPDATLVGDRGSVLASEAEFGRFIAQFSIQQGCMPYPLDVVGHLTVRGFCELYVGESYPEPPAHALPDSGYPPVATAPDRLVFEPRPFPICFVLGCGRSGTTLFRAMLNRHDGLWAPGELHLAQFDTMAERAGAIGPFLRHALVPEVAERLDESADAFGDRLAGWEQAAVPVPDVYQQLHQADPGRLIVDKTPSYSARIEHLEWIDRHFEGATYVHIVRNPHDVIRSLVRIQLYKQAAAEFEPGVSPHHVAETIWFGHNDNITRFLEGIAEDRHVLVRYEDLVADPARTLGTVCDVVGVGYEPAMAEPYAGGGGQVASGAGDPRVNLVTEVEVRAAGPAFYPLGGRAQTLARRFGY
ncbi:MAG: sulfotransferase family protein [Acidimicrobiales bacterium]